MNIELQIIKTLVRRFPAVVPHLKGRALWYNRTNILKCTRDVSASGYATKHWRLDMKSIPLARGLFALVDDGDYDLVSQYHWTYDGRYASFQDWRTRKKIFMHRLVANTPDGYETDHLNCNKLDNRRSNLRVCTQSQNKANVDMPRTNNSGYKGVSWIEAKHKWRANIMVNKKTIHLGYFTDPINAAKAYDKAAKEKFGVFAKVNFE